MRTGCGRGAASTITGAVLADREARTGGEVTKAESWGKRRLAYEIRKQREGTYAVIEGKAEPTMMKEYERQLTLNEQVLRHFTTRVPVRKRIRSAPKPQTPAVEEVS